MGYVYHKNLAGADLHSPHPPVASTDHAFVRWDGAGGDTLLDGAVICDDTGNVSGMGTLGCGAITSTGASTFNSGSVDADFTVNWNTGVGLFVQGSDGFVGIGTTTPTEKLEVVDGSGYIQMRTTPANSNAGLKLENDARTWVLVNRGSDLADYFVIRDITAGSDRLTIDTSGNVGIGTATPGEKLTINGDFSHLKAVRKEDTTTIDEDDTLTEDTYLKLATTVPGLWTFHNTIFVTTTTNADFKFRYTFPASTTDAVIHYVVYVDNTVVKQGYSAKSPGNDYTTNVSIDYADAPSVDAIVVNGYALTTAAGNIALEWAQRVSHVDNTTVWARSFINGELGDA